MALIFVREFYLPIVLYNELPLDFESLIKSDIVSDPDTNQPYIVDDFQLELANYKQFTQVFFYTMYHSKVNVI